MIPTTITSWALTIVRAAESYGIERDTLLERAGLEPALLNDPQGRYPVAGMARLWTAAIEAANDPAFGLVVARFWHPTTFNALGFAWMASDTLEQAFYRLRRYFRLVTTGAVVRFVEQPDSCQFVLTPAPGLAVVKPPIADAAAATIHHMCRLLYGEQFALQKLELIRPKPVSMEPYEGTFACPIAFSRPEIVLHLNRSMVQKPLPTANIALAHANDRLVTEYLAQIDKHDLPSQVKTKLIDMLPSGEIQEEQVAQALNLSLRSLQRRLNEHRLTFRMLLNDTRRELALVYVRSPRMSLAEVSYLLGFSEPGNFTRAFRRWTGATPTEYRMAASSRLN